MKNLWTQWFPKKPPTVEPTPEPIVRMLGPAPRVVLEGVLIDADDQKEAHQSETARDATHSTESWFQRLNRKGRRAGKRLGGVVQDWWKNGNRGTLFLNVGLFLLQALLWICWFIVATYWCVLLYMIAPVLGVLFLALLVGGALATLLFALIEHVFPGLASLYTRLFADS